MSNTYRTGPAGIIGGSNHVGASIYGPRTRHPPVTVYNSGTVTVFVDRDDPIGSPSQGIPLTPGSSIAWDANSPLFAVSATNSSVVVIENTAGPFDVGAIATAIVSAGLAQDIATAIYVTGTPPVDKLAALTTDTLTNGYTSAAFDVAGYQSLVYAVTQGNAGLLTPGWINVKWYADSGATLLIGEDDFFLGQGNAGSLTTYTAAVRGPFVQVRVVTGTGSALLRLYGSYKAAPRNAYTAEGPVPNATGGSGTQLAWSGTIPVSTTWVWTPDIVAGRNRLYISCLPSAASVINIVCRIPLALVTTPDLNYVNAPSALVPAGPTRTEFIYEVDFLAAPVELSLRNPSSTATMAFTASIVAEPPFS